MIYEQHIVLKNPWITIMVATICRDWWKWLNDFSIILLNCLCSMLKWGHTTGRWCRDSKYYVECRTLKLYFEVWDLDPHFLDIFLWWNKAIMLSFIFFNYCNTMPFSSCIILHTSNKLWLFLYCINSMKSETKSILFVNECPKPTT